jgi:hypothetical protein
MKRNQRENFLKLTVAEPFPVIPSFPEPRCGEGKGPFFNAGATWHYPMHTKEHVERMAIHLRGLGYTVTVSA